MKSIDRAFLTLLIDIVEEELASVPAHPGYGNDAGFGHYKLGLDAAISRLRERTGGKVDDRPNWEGSRVKIAGIQSTCTAGIEGALKNWLVAARKRLAA